MEFLKTFLGGAGGAALVAGLFALIQSRLNRKDQEEDNATAQKYDQCTARGEDLKELSRLVNVLCVADRTILYDRIKHLGKSYIARGYVTLEELEDLTTMHSVYHDEDKLNGNGFLDDIMAAVRQLEKRVS
jgi:hypothetical protein